MKKKIFSLMIGSEISRAYSSIAQTAKDGIVATDYILAPLCEKRLLGLKVTFNAEAEKTITSEPFQQSYKTNIKGEYSNLYSSTFTVNNEVEDYINNPEVEFPENKLKVGSFYYSENTSSNTFAAAKIFGSTTGTKHNSISVRVISTF